MKLFEGVYQIDFLMGERVLHQYLLVGDRSLLVDTGTKETPEKTTLPYLDSIGLKREALNFALNTHCDADHFGGNSELLRLVPTITLMAHKADRDQIEDPNVTMELRYNSFSKDHGIEYTQEVKSWLRGMMGERTRLHVLLQGGEVFQLSDHWAVEVIHAPGHSHGHVAVWDPKHKALIIGDAVLWKYIPATDGKPALPPSYMYVDEYLSTINRFKGLKPDVLLTAHYPNMKGEEVTMFLDESTRFAQQAEREIIRALRKSRTPLTLRELIETVGVKLTPVPLPARMDLSFPFRGHLERLTHEHKVRRVKKNGLTAWKKAQR